MEHGPTSCFRTATRVLLVGAYMLCGEFASPHNMWCMLWLISYVAFDAYFNNGKLSRHVFYVDLNNSKEDHPPLRQHICLMSKRSGWFPSAEKLLKIFFFFPRIFQATTKPCPPTEDGPIELPHSEKSRARLFAVTVTLSFIPRVTFAFSCFVLLFHLLRFTNSLL